MLGMDRRLLGRQWQDGWRCDLGRVATRNQNLCEEEIIRMLCRRRRLATRLTKCHLEALGRARCNRICTLERLPCGEWCGGATWPQQEANGEEDDGRWGLGQGAACSGDVGSGNRKS